MSDWDPALYARFEAFRGRPARDLIARIPDALEPREIWDLGCGTGAQAADLKRRYPAARVFGLDSSAAMLAKAAERDVEVEWVRADIADWAPERPADLIFTNAAMHWLGDHERLFPDLAARLAPGGLLACQMPRSFGEPWHELARETAAQGPWAARLAGVDGIEPLLAPEAYHDLLAPFGETQVWTTTYLHALPGEDAVVAWMSGTGLRPYLAALDDPAERAAFTAAYRERVAPLYPRRADGTTLLPFPRLFMTLRRAG